MTLIMTTELMIMTTTRMIIMMMTRAIEKMMTITAIIVLMTAMVMTKTQ